jgi:glycine/D-amino acid oxidase-like deaminating enzyme
VSELRSDVAIVGGGIAGLWTAKNLVDRGYSVNVVEKSNRLADGATVRNEGWLHSGAYHGAILEDDDTALAVMEKIKWSSNQITEFAPESLESQSTYALLGEGLMARRALDRWRKANIDYRQVADINTLTDAEGLDSQQTKDVYRVADKSVNTRLLCSKLAHYIIERGANIFTDVVFKSEDEGSATLLTESQEEHTLASDHFVITAGSGTGELMGDFETDLNLRYFKAHLLWLPRLTRHNYFSIDSYGINFMNHGNSSIAGLNLDTTEVSFPDHTVERERVDRIVEILGQLAPRAMAYENVARGIACIKPGMQKGEGPRRPGVEAEIFPLSETYTCAFPGKMTEAPYLAKELVEYLEAKGVNPSAKMPRISTVAPAVSSRPIDLS